jgi:outer membrane protein OmpA-like peptidoglycan-associated protein
MKLQRFGLAAAGLTMALAAAGAAQAQTTQATIAEGRCQRVLAPGQTYPGPFTVLFDTGKSVIKPEFKAELKKVAEQAKTLFVTRICLIGTADKVGNAAFNQKLARDRANAVARELIANGVQNRYLLIDPNPEAYKDWSFGKREDQQQDRKAIVVFAK